MQNDDSTLLHEMKIYEERLAQNPDSLQFARLAEIYLDAGRLDDALRVAKNGTERYPGYVVGLRVLARICHEKGLLDECFNALEKVTQAFPEDLDSLKMLGRILASQDNYRGAMKIFGMALEFHPDDVECRSELELLERRMIFLPAEAIHNPNHCETSAEEMRTVSKLFAYATENEADEDPEIIDLTEADLLEIDLLELDEEEPDTEYCSVVVPGDDPLATATLADLYVQQGFTDKALEIYSAILAADPDNTEIRSKIAMLENTHTFDSVSAVDGYIIKEEAVQCRLNLGAASADPTLAQSGSNEAIAVLEGWLGNISKLKSEIDASSYNSYHSNSYGS
ncbi:MAG: tetratricopeptide repeat protein [Deltaproteobacteria bacterium]